MASTLLGSFYRCPGRKPEGTLHRDTELRRRCERELSTVFLPRPFTVEGLCRQLEEQRGRPLYLHPLSMPAATAGACGLWLATDTDDHFFVEQATCRKHREHIVLHEIGHMLCDHSSTVSEENFISGLLTDLDPQLIKRLLTRTNYSTSQEQEAEMIASLIRTRAHPAGEVPADNVQANLQASLGLEGTRG